jgi:hypothetical protein
MNIQRVAANFLVGGILVCGFSAGANAKCGPLLLRINGEMKGHSSKEKIVVTIAPDATPSKPVILVEDNRFEADVYYDPFKSYSRLFGFNCTKRPEHITVALMNGDKQVAKVELSFDKDFQPDGQGGFRLRSKLRLGA